MTFSFAHLTESQLIYVIVIAVVLLTILLSILLCCFPQRAYVRYGHTMFRKNIKKAFEKDHLPAEVLKEFDTQASILAKESLKKSYPFLAEGLAVRQSLNTIAAYRALISPGGKKPEEARAWLNAWQKDDLKGMAGGAVSGLTMLGCGNMFRPLKTAMKMMIPNTFAAMYPTPVKVHDEILNEQKDGVASQKYIGELSFETTQCPFARTFHERVSPDRNGETLPDMEDLCEKVICEMDAFQIFAFNSVMQQKQQEQQQLLSTRQIVFERKGIQAKGCKGCDFKYTYTAQGPPKSCCSSLCTALTSLFVYFFLMVFVCVMICFLPIIIPLVFLTMLSYACCGKDY